MNELCIKKPENKLKKRKRKRFCAVTKKIFKSGKVFVTTVQRANLTILCTAFCYNLYKLMELKIKEYLEDSGSYL